MNDVNTIANLQRVIANLQRVIRERDEYTEELQKQLDKSKERLDLTCMLLGIAQADIAQLERESIKFRWIMKGCSSIQRRVIAKREETA